MECYITYCIKGFLAFNEDFELIAKKLFPKESIVTALMEIENKKIASQEKRLLKKFQKTMIKSLLNQIKESLIIPA